eukprot:4194517-Pleurochrysis_carterae.AAC.1
MQPLPGDAAQPVQTVFAPARLREWRVGAQKTLYRACTTGISSASSRSRPPLRRCAAKGGDLLEILGVQAEHITTH